VWSGDGNVAYRAGRDIKAGRVWTNCYHAYPAHAALGGYKVLFRRTFLTSRKFGESSTGKERSRGRRGGVVK
jgi:hypothetical protein